MSSPPTEPRRLQRVGVAVGGGATVLLGIALIPLPGPGTVVILGGLAMLRKEFPAAGTAADRITSGARRAASTTARTAGRVRRMVTTAGGSLIARAQSSSESSSGPDRPTR